jgi:putative membrane protein
MIQSVNETVALRTIYIVSLLVFVAVVVLFMMPKADNMPDFVRFLPALNAILNGSTALLLMASFVAIKRRQIELHKKLNLAAFVLSSLFLLSYVTFHAFGVETRFPEDNPVRPVYLFILLTHILLAAIVLPMVLISFYYGLTGKLDKHRKLVRFSFPIWLYVTVTGVVVYLMISPYYQF